MKKSTAYKIAQLSVLTDDSIDAETKLFVLSTLMEEENLAKWQEDHTDSEVAVGE